MLCRLNDQGEISKKPKKVLVRIIFTCFARGQYREVQVAYELLLCDDINNDNNNNNNNNNNSNNNDNDNNIAKEVFSNQYIVL